MFRVFTNLYFVIIALHKKIVVEFFSILAHRYLPLGGIESLIIEPLFLSNHIMAKSELYFVTDIETDGPIPGPHSMLSFACVAMNAAGESVGEFSVNLETLPDAQAHPITAAFWRSEPQAWAACRENPVAPEQAMKAYVAWVYDLCAHHSAPVFVGYPAGFDFTFVFWYLQRFTGGSPFSWSALDMKTFGMALSGLPFKQTIKPKLPAEWLPENLPHTHIALDDAREQAHIFAQMLRAWQQSHDNQNS